MTYIKHDPWCTAYEHATFHEDEYWCDDSCDADCLCDLINEIRNDQTNKCIEQAANAMSFSQSLFFEMFKNAYENRSSIPKDAPAIGDLWCDEMLVFRIWDGTQWISVKDKS